MNLSVGLDIDNTIADFNFGYLKRFGKWPKYDWCITRNVKNILMYEKDFWLNLPVIRTPDFTPKLFCSARINNKRWTKKYLTNLGLDSPLYQVPGYNLSKARVLRGKIDVFIEDSLKNFIDLNLKGIPCLLIDEPHNKEWGPIGRIYSLKESEIEDCYSLFMGTVFYNFKELINGNY